MEVLTFGEQVKIVLGRKGMTIKELAELIEVKTGKKMSRQNLTQRLGRDNFQEQDMRMIAEILDCPFQLNILTGEITPAPPKMTISKEKESVIKIEETSPSDSEEVDMTIGELYEIHQELTELEKPSEEPIDENFEPVIQREDEEEDIEVGDVNPYTGREYQSNSVRMHPTRIGYVQVYDRAIHRWTDMTEWAFLGYQERKKSVLGKDYEPPIYLD